MRPNPLQNCDDVELNAGARGIIDATLPWSPQYGCRELLMVSGFVERLILIDKGDNSTESQYYLDLEKRLSLQFSIAVTVVLLSIFACCGRRVP